MIKFAQINTVLQEPPVISGYKSINVLRWKDEWKELCPYYMKTDGNEEIQNPGGVLFENFWQGIKVYDRVFSQKIYPSRFQQGNPKYLWWEYNAPPEGELLYEPPSQSLEADGGGKWVNKEAYLKWRDSIWSCKNPLRYPNGFYNRTRCQFATDHTLDVKMDYITARKKVYVKEYIRLVKKTEKYEQLVQKLENGEKLLICEVDVPAAHKKGPYGQVNREVDLNYINELLEFPGEAFGHGICLAKALLEEFE